MNNEIGRKLTSLTLMTIMLAGGMTIAAPSMMVPEVAAAGALYVSAENATFENHFGGAQIVEVVVIGHATATDVKAGEPMVKVDEHQLRMAQGIDGNWYGYFGDSTAVPAADEADNNLDFGLDRDLRQIAGSVSASNVYVNATTGTIKNAPELSNWNATKKTNESGVSGVSLLSTVIGVGQINIANSDAHSTGETDREWPFIQLYDFTVGSFDVVYEQAGADEVVSLEYDSGDMDDYAGVTLDRNAASQSSQLHLTITDNQLNIDPTAEDIVIFYVETGNESVGFTNGTHTTASFIAYDNSFDDNGKLIINNNTNSAAIAVLNSTTSLDDVDSDNHLVFWESAENSGVFGNTDDDDASNLYVHPNAKRGTTATIDYNDSAQSFIVANSFGTITMDAASVGDEWNSGEALTVTLDDEDLNKNTGSSEDLYITNSTNTHLVPSLQIGSPLSVLAAATNITAVTDFSKIAYYTESVSTPVVGNTLNITINTGYSGVDLNNMNTSNTYFNFDFSAFTNSTNPVVAVCLDGTGNAAHIACSTGENKGIVKLFETPYGVDTGDLSIQLQMTQDNGNGARGTGTALTSLTDIPFVADIFSFDDSGTNNAIYRLELGETGGDTGIFTGSVEYIMLNQINKNLDATYTDLSTVDSDIDIIIEQDMTDEDSPRINYFDLGADGVSTQIADQLEAPTHSGVVSFDLDNYKIADTVVVTLNDQDMNTDSELIDVYTTNSDNRVGAASGTTLATGLVLDITFDDVNWDDTGDDASCDALGSSDGSDGLEATGFTLVETDTASGIFTGSFQVPSKFCHSGSSSTVTVTGTDMEVNYQDFRNASGESIEVGDGASINANTGSVSFDRTVYPVPFGAVSGGSIFLEHATATGSADLGATNVTVHVRVTDADYNVSAMGEDKISDANVTINIERGSNVEFLTTVGNTSAYSGSSIV